MALNKGKSNSGRNLSWSSLTGRRTIPRIDNGMFSNGFLRTCGPENSNSRVNCDEEGSYDMSWVPPPALPDVIRISGLEGGPGSGADELEPKPWLGVMRDVATLSVYEISAGISFILLTVEESRSLR